MRIVIDDRVLKKYNVGLDEVLVLMEIFRSSNLDKITTSLVSQQLLTLNNNNKIITEQGKDLLDKILTESEDPEDANDPLIHLATVLKSYFPKGKKPGTNYYWAEAVPLIVKRLKLFFAKYGENYTHEEIITATKRYIDSFNGDYRYMKLLKYFIFRDRDRFSGEADYSSELLTYLENKGEAEETFDWMTDLK